MFAKYEELKINIRLNTKDKTIRKPGTISNCFNFSYLMKLNSPRRFSKKFVSFTL